MISIIIPVYNVEKYLIECLDSCFKQSYYEIEIIAVNDGSSDNSGMILDEYAVKESRLRVFHQSNQGVAEARNRGILAAVGEWLAFVDSDDYLLPGALELMLKAANGNDAKVVIAGFVDSEKGVPKIDLSVSNVICLSNSEVVEEIVNEKLLPSLCGKLFHRSRFGKLPKHESRIRIGEDFLLTLYLLKNACEVIIVNAPVYYYRQRSDSVMRAPSAEATLSRLHFIRYVECFLNKYGDFAQRYRETLIVKLALRELFSFLRDGGDIAVALVLLPDIRVKYLKNKEAISQTPFWRILIIRSFLINPVVGRFINGAFVVFRKYLKR